MRRYCALSSTLVSNSTQWLPAIMLCDKSSLYTILHLGPEWLFQKGCPFLARRHEYSECGSYKSAARCVRIMWNIEDMMCLIQRGQCSRLGTHFGIAIASLQKILFLLFERLWWIVLVAGAGHIWEWPHTFRFTVVLEKSSIKAILRCGENTRCLT